MARLKIATEGSLWFLWVRCKDLLYIGLGHVLQAAMKFIRTPEEVVQSRVAWPFTRAGDLAVLTIEGLALASTIAWLKICEASESCTDRHWQSSFWGEARNASASEEYCETFQENALMELPINSMSNLGFCVVGLFAILCGLADRVRVGSFFAAPDDAPFNIENHTILCPLYSLLYGTSSFLFGSFSFMYYAHNTKLTEQLDVGGVFATLNFVIAGSFMMIFNPDMPRDLLIPIRLAIFLLVVILTFIMTFYNLSITVKNLMYGQIAAALGFFFLACIRRGLLRRGQPDRIFFRAWRNIFISGFGLGLGFAMLNVGESLKYCDPDNFFQFNAFWHFLCAFAILTIYLFYRSERMHKPKYMRNMQVEPAVSSFPTDLRSASIIFRADSQTSTPLSYIDPKAHSVS